MSSRCAQITEVGWSKDLAITALEISTPPTGNQIQVEIEACGVCHRDLIDRSGRFKFIRVPITPGHEAVGRVTKVGPDVVEWQVGDRVATMHRDFCGECEACKDNEVSLCAGAAAVLGLLVNGGYATHMVAPERCFYAMDDNVEAKQAAIFHCTLGTAYRGLTRFGKIKAGSRVAIVGANGGVGAAAIQIVDRMGAYPIAIVRDSFHHDFLMSLGAAEVLVDPGNTFHKRLSGGTANIVLDCVGEPTFNSSMRSLRVGGKMVVVGNIVPEKASLNLGYIITRGLQITGSSGASRVDMENVLRLHREKPFHSIIHQELSLDEADKAQRLVRSGGLRGRIVLTP